MNKAIDFCEICGLWPLNKDMKDLTTSEITSGSAVRSSCANFWNGHCYRSLAIGESRRFYYPRGGN